MYWGISMASENSVRTQMLLHILKNVFVHSLTSLKEAVRSHLSLPSHFFLNMFRLSLAPVHMETPLSAGHTLTDCLPQNTELMKVLNDAGHFNVVCSLSQTVTSLASGTHVYFTFKYLFTPAKNGQFAC